MIDIRTPKERERDERNHKIKNDFRKLRGENPGASDFRLFTVISKTYKLSPLTVRKIILEKA